MPNLSLDELEQIAEMRRIKGYKSLLSTLHESERNFIESSGSVNNFNNDRIKKIREDFKLRD